MANIKFEQGNLLEANVDTLVNTVNCVGIMGRGVALQFKNAYPDNFAAYKRACDLDQVQPGRMFVFETGQFNPRYIINFPTKRHWKGKSRMEDIDSGLVAMVEEIRKRKIKSIALPPLGSGLGGLDWREVRPRIVAALTPIDDLAVVVFEPREAPAATKSKAVPKMTMGRAALVGLMHRYLQGLMDPFVTLLEVHKLMYFMQAAGQDLNLKYSKAAYGPYAENLRHVLNAIEGHLVSGYADGGDDPEKQIELVPGAIEDAGKFLGSDQDAVARFDRVADLVGGFETPYGLELLATVHWVTTQEGADSAKAVIEQVHSWNDRKRKFTPRQIELAYLTLRSKGWTELAA
ncbi:MAG: Appr-p processing domain protein [Devosia sp.]|uniref:type II toxin-antitoxin system antitoxin DNA ADP-ribosyl glycohydrolase DarG n=1 Tax=Devosia sp. TaxID=1871048 RepID=UPI00260B4B90|nr:macro domain-containing protein [Devosia sp.]MDB5538772.1 Appr-p processing domain protein [Devosia sp.]